MGLVNLDIALSRKEPIESRIDLRRFPEWNIRYWIYSSPRLPGLFPSILLELIFFWDGGGWVDFPVPKNCWLAIFFAARLQAGVESLARRFWSRKFHERRTPHSLVGRRLGMAGNMPFQRWKFQWNDLKFHAFGSNGIGCESVLAYCKCEAVSPVLSARSGRGMGTCRYWMVHDDSNSLPMFFFDDFDLIEIMQNPAIYYYSIHQLWARAFTRKSCMSLSFLKEKSPELPKHLPNQHADFGENKGEIPSSIQAGKVASTTALTLILRGSQRNIIEDGNIVPLEGHQLFWQRLWLVNLPPP